MKLAWLLVPLAFQLPSQCDSFIKNSKKGASVNAVMHCTKEREKCRTPTGGVGVCAVGDGSQCENPPCLICSY
jgi:hypothetical protein